MTKHILSLTYEPKIPDVRNGKCTQTIRPYSESKPKQNGDLIAFHGWKDKPYRSKWTWRTLYWEITEVFNVIFCDDCLVNDDNGFSIGFDKSNEIANQDGFKDYFEMLDWFKDTYGKKLYDILFQVIRWNPNRYKLKR